MTHIVGHRTRRNVENNYATADCTKTNCYNFGSAVQRSVTIVIHPHLLICLVVMLMGLAGESLSALVWSLLISTKGRNGAGMKPVLLVVILNYEHSTELLPHHLCVLVGLFYVSFEEAIFHVILPSLRI